MLEGEVSQESSARSGPSDQNRLFVATTLAMAVMMIAGTEMNSHVFPLFDPIFMFARDISVTFNAVALLTLGAVAYASSKVLTPRSFVAITFGCLVLGAVGLSFSLAIGSALLLTIGSSVCAIGRAGAMLFACLACALLSSRAQVTAICVSFFLQALWQLISPFVPSVVSLSLFQLLPLFAFLLVMRPGTQVLSQVCKRESPSDLSVTRPASFVAPFSALFICMFLFQTAFGFALRFDEVDGASPFINVNWLFVLGVSAFALAGRKFKFITWDQAVSFAGLVIIGGFLLVSSGKVPYHEAAIVLLNGGNVVFTLASRVVLVAIAGRNLAGSVTVVGWGLGVTSLGSLAGAGAGMLCHWGIALNHEMVFFIPATILMVFVAYLLFGLRNFSFTKTVRGIEPLPAEPTVLLAPTPSEAESFENRCQAIGEEFGLSPREREVFAMLARGRDRAYIEEELVVSKNTAKAHVKHVYAKLGIHSHQELLDLVEAG